jgi:hypothetical protein
MSLNSPKSHFLLAVIFRIFFFLLLVNAKCFANFFNVFGGEGYGVLKWGTMRYTLSSPCITMIEKGRSSRRNVGSCIITRALRTIIVGGID